MSIELSVDATKTATDSIQRYFSENMDEPIGGLQAGALLSFFLKEIGPAVYNKAISDAQARMQQRVTELDVEVYEEEFSYWMKQGRKGGGSEGGLLAIIVMDTNSIRKKNYSTTMCSDGTASDEAFLSPCAGNSMVTFVPTESSNTLMPTNSR